MSDARSTPTAHGAREHTSEHDARAAEAYDVVVVGAGFAGLYQVHAASQRGWTVLGIDAAPDVGGTWYWNAYPGARCDVESMSYSYSFSPDLDQEWTWTERYAAQPEILAYLRHVASRFGLRQHLRLATRVDAAHWMEDRDRWRIVTDDGVVLEARWCVFATGTLSAPLRAPFEGVESFEGDWYETQRWPHEEVRFEGDRVGVIGSGSSAIQIVPEIAGRSASLSVFQRTPNFSVPARNRALTTDEIAARKQKYPAHREAQRAAQSGYPLWVNERDAHEMSAEERAAELERRWEIGGAPVFNWSFNDVVTNRETNTIVSDFVRAKIRSTVHEPEVAERLVPFDHPIVAKRLCADHGYFEAFNEPHVRLVDIRANPIRRIVPEGIELEDGSVHELDTIVSAIGYDAISGPMLRIDVRGRDGLRLQDAWADGPVSYLGLMVAGFPNMFLVTGPASPAVLAVMTVAIEQHVEWIGRCLDDLTASGRRVIEPNALAQRSWMTHVAEIAAGTVFPGDHNSYYLGANVPGKPRAFALYAGGQKRYRDEVADIVDGGYVGFTRR